MRQTLFAAVFSLIAVVPAVAAVPATPEAGRKVALRACAGCHEVEGTGASPREDAPTFRRLARSMEPARFMAMLQDGLLVTHSNMPTARLGADEAAALAAYFEKLRPPYVKSSR